MHFFDLIKSGKFYQSLGRPSVCFGTWLLITSEGGMLWAKVSYKKKKNHGCMTLCKVYSLNLWSCYFIKSISSTGHYNYACYMKTRRLREADNLSDAALLTYRRTWKKHGSSHVQGSSSYTLMLLSDRDCIMMPLVSLNAKEEQKCLWGHYLSVTRFHV